MQVFTKTRSKKKCRHTLVAKDFIHHYGNLFSQKQQKYQQKQKQKVHQLIVKKGINRVALHTLLKCSYCLLPRPKTAYESPLSHSPLSFPYIHKIIIIKSSFNTKPNRNIQSKPYLCEPFIKPRSVICRLTISISTRK